MLRRLALPLAALAVVAGYVVYWHQVAKGVPGWVGQWADQARARGYLVEHGAIDVTGFPFKLEVTVADVTFGRADRAGVWAWRGAFVHALIKPWDFERILLTVPEEHRLEPATGGALRVRQALNQTALVIADGAPRVIGIDLRDVTIEDATGTTATVGVLELRYELGEADDGQPQRAYGLRLAGIDPGVAPPTGLPAVINELSVVARLVGPPPETGDRAAVELWRDAGGAVEIDTAKVHWGPFDMTADGTVALDSAFRPLGAFKVGVGGWDAALEAATGAGLLAPGQMLAIRATLDAIAQDDGLGGRRAEIAVSIQDGQVFVGPLPVARVPPLPID